MLFRNQDFLCLPHYAGLLELSQRAMKNPVRIAFQKECAELVRKKVKTLCSGTKRLIDAFDYRNENIPMPEPSKNAIEKIFAFLVANSR